MRRRVGIVWTVMMLVWLSSWAPAPAAVVLPLANQISEQLWERVLTAGTPPQLRAAGESLRAESLVARFYTRRLFWPAWITATGLAPQAESLLQALREAEAEGLRPRDYHLARLETLCAELRQHQLSAPGRTAALAQLDLDRKSTRLNSSHT